MLILDPKLQGCCRTTSPVSVETSDPKSFEVVSPTYVACRHGTNSAKIGTRDLTGSNANIGISTAVEGWNTRYVLSGI